MTTMHTTSARGLRLLLSSIALATLAACGGGEGVGKDGDVVGGPCGANGDCADGSRCIVEGDFPGGMCTRSCDSNDDCPSGAVCISNESGICMYTCSSTATDCREGYECEPRSLERDDGKADVCGG